MSRRREIISLVLADFLALSFVWGIYYWIRVQSGWVSFAIRPDFFVPMIAVWLYWLVIFAVFGLYGSWYAKGRIDEIALILKVGTIGCLLLFFVIFLDDQATNTVVHARLLILIYWSLLISSVSVGRFIVHSFHRRLLLMGIGLAPTVIVGSATKVNEVRGLLKRYPGLGHEVIGAVKIDASEPEERYFDLAILGDTSQLASVIRDRAVKEVVIALESSEHPRLLEILASCEGMQVGFKIMPDMYDIISGQARTNQIYGVPLIQIAPELMKPWELVVKRIMDVSVAFVVLIVGLPLWILISAAIMVESRGGIVYRQERVGKDGRVFRMIKFRSMFQDAEHRIGPQWAQKNDPRVTRVGRFLRKSHLDEIPNFINVLFGDMSLVGPRPERPFFVDQFSKEIPFYRRRLKVRPGITGWAQVKHKYDESLEDVRKKLEYDFFYVENMSLRMDVRIMLYTVFSMLFGKGQA